MPEHRIRTHKYSDKLLRKWKKDWRWVDGHPTKENLVVCTVCGVTLVPKRHGIKAHANSRSHKEFEILRHLEKSKIKQAEYETVSINATSNVTFGNEQHAQIPLEFLGHQSEEMDVQKDETVTLFASVTKVKARGSYPRNILKEIGGRLLSGRDWDTTWQCRDAIFKVHRIILAIFSPYLRRLMNENERECFIYTPELTCIHLRSIICLFYTGSTVIREPSHCAEIEKTLKLLECNASLQIEQVNAVKLETEQIDNIVMCDPTTDSPAKTSNIETIVVHPYINESWYDQLHYEPSDGDAPGSPTRNKLEKLVKAEAVLDDVKIEIDDSEGLFDDCKSNGAAVERYTDTKYRYYLKGNRQGLAKKGVLSRNLITDLFVEAPADLLSISVCTLCYQPFQTKQSLELHLEHAHCGTRKKKHGAYHISDTKYKCPTCKEEIIVGHIVWFVKHMRFCGNNSEKALDLLAPGQDDIPIQNEKEKYKVLDEDKLEGTKQNSFYVRTLCKKLTGHQSDTIWGCRRCYEAFKSKDELIDHVERNHEGKVEYGNCYDQVNKQYTCMYCNLSFKFTLVKFINHIKFCGVNPELSARQWDEEEGDDSDAQDIVDPWGVVNKPLKVVNLRSQWICECLFGKLVPVIYPCHVCYDAFSSCDDLKKHFSSKHHPDTVNTLENGPYYNKMDDSYNCPVCNKIVCKNQKTSIYFTYHMKKCSGKLHSVTKKCDKCSKSFTSYDSFMEHQRNNCYTNEFTCHICSKVLKCRSFLLRHVKEVHNEHKGFMCGHCPKTFKRKGELKIHEATHNTVLSFSCDQCGKAFKAKKNLDLHVKNVHVAYEDKKHACSHCPLRFARRDKLMDHIATHGILPAFECDLCDSKHKTRESLRVHRKKVHNVKANTAIKQNISPLLTPINEEDLVQIEILPESITTTEQGDPVPAPQISYRMSYKKKKSQKKNKKMKADFSDFDIFS